MPPLPLHILSIKSSVLPLTGLNFSTGSHSPLKHSYSHSFAKGLWRLVNCDDAGQAVAELMLVLVLVLVDVYVLSIVYRLVLVLKLVLVLVVVLVVNRIEEQ